LLSSYHVPLTGAAERSQRSHNKRFVLLYGWINAPFELRVQATPDRQIVSVVHHKLGLAKAHTTWRENERRKRMRDQPTALPD